MFSKSRGLWGSISERVSGAENKDFSPCITPMPLPNRKASFLGPKLWRPLLQAPKSPPPCPWFPGDPNSGGGWREGGPRRPGRGGEPVGGVTGLWGSELAGRPSPSGKGVQGGWPQGPRPWVAGSEAARPRAGLCSWARGCLSLTQCGFYNLWGGGGPRNN